MPLILDNPMDEAAMQVDLDDVDDLFGDGVPLALPPRPPSKRLHQRLDELRRSGCCQGVAWSKTGTIASISPGGHSLELRYLCADPKTAQWGLSDATHFTPSTSFPGGPIVHLTWSPTNTSSELAVIDSVGRTSIFNFATNLNRPSRVRGWDTDPVDDLHMVVGSYWLNLMPTHASKVHPLYSPAVKVGDKYKYEPSFVPISGPYHPNPSRSALITVTTRGLLKMFWYQANGKLEETKIDLESVNSADDLITHASICSDMKTVLFVSLMTQSKQLRVVQVKILWDGQRSEGQQTQQQPNRPLNPSLSVKHLAVTTWLSGEQDSHLGSAMPKVSLLEFLPTSPNQATKKMAAPVIVAVRSFVPTLSSPYNQEIQSSIDVWELQPDSQQTVHPAFEKLGTRRSSVGQPNQDPLCLRKLDSIIVDKVVVGITQVPLGRAICFAYSDGTIEYRDRFTLQPMYNEVNLDRITSMLEVGFTQEGESSCLQSALSPTSLSVIQINEAGKLHWHSLRYGQDTSSPLTAGQLSSVVAAMTMATAQSAYAQINIDDLLSIARHFKQQDGFSSQWMTEMVHLSKIIVDYAEEVPHDHLFRNNQLQLFFSILNHVGWNGTTQQRDFQSKLSTIALNLRNIVILITIANNNTHSGRGPTPMDDTEVVSALAGCCKWSIDLLSWLCDSLFCLLDDTKFMALLQASPPQFSQLTDYLHQNNDVALHMIMCSSIRGLLNAVCRRINLLDNLSVMALKYYESRAGKDEPAATPGAPTGAKGGSYGSPLHMAYQRIQRHTSSAMIKISDFDALLTTFGTAIRTVYKASSEHMNKQQQQQNTSNGASGNSNPKDDAGARARATCELTLLLGGPPPPSFQDILCKLFKQDLTNLRSQTDAARLFFADYSLLEIDDEPKALERKRARGAHVDMFKRVEIVKGVHGGSASRRAGSLGGDHESGAQQAPAQWRMCVRCASVMEDFGPVHNRPNLAFVLSQQRNCSCGGRMVLLPLTSGDGNRGK
ncbi:RNA polymerase II mediator complex subunit Sin4 [Microdochium trichocladiopsis]|uniref:Mediator of RNA polymerase II transcription subunit 16 n=1 Tax=Microdochium trichocladiopsis TaxID=1682393 RepID=A0A9P8Y136_9PEZI|nr:RNA polymerase II mediator complex subunit Sin4 [Microdochium trichocladiopsis]KAH7026556.1 RNA polymerase II mediator complex subunit Sin4 [Microdochium trichocladiopsis]